MDKCIYNVARRYMILPVVVFVSSLVFAGEVEFKNIHYVVDEDHLTAVVAPTPKASGNIVIPEEINAEGDKYRVVAIGEKAFPLRWNALDGTPSKVRACSRTRPTGRKVRW